MFLRYHERCKTRNLAAAAVAVAASSSPSCTNVRRAPPPVQAVAFCERWPSADVLEGGTSANGPLPVFSSEKIAVPHGMRHRPCGSSTRSGRPPSRFHEKAIKISNVFRQALGLPLIETEGAVLFALDHGANHIHVNHGFVTILPNKPVGPDRHNPFVDFENGSPINHFIPPMGAGPFDGNIEILPVSPPYPNHCHHHPHHQLYRGESNSFATRLHASLMNLGPWEGRAVAFVLGKSLCLSVVRSVTKLST